MLGKVKYNLRGGGEDPDENKDKVPKKSCHAGSVGRYGVPKSGIKYIGQVVNIAFNDRSKSFEFQVEHYLEHGDQEQVHLFWLTWSEMMTYHQYQVAFWFYLRNNLPRGDEFEAQVPSSTAVRALEQDGETEEDQ